MIKRDYPRRTETRVWQAERPTTEPVAQVQDEGMRAYLLVERRSLLMRVAEIERRCGIANADDADPLTA